jgi:hypothetical protein
VVNLLVGVLAGEVHAKPLSHASDDTAEVRLVGARCRCRVDVGRGVAETT